MKILVLIGSLRKNSWNRKLFRAYEEINGGEAGVKFTEGRFETFPLYNEDVQAVGFPADVVKLGEQIRACDAVLFVSPEYNYSVPGALKNCLDWISRLSPQPLARKRCSVIGASPGKIGTARMQYHLRQIGVFLDIHFMNKPEVMVSSVPSVFDSAGEKLIDEGTRKFLKTHFAALREFVSGVEQ